VRWVRHRCWHVRTSVDVWSGHRCDVPVEHEWLSMGHYSILGVFNLVE